MDTLLIICLSFTKKEPDIDRLVFDQITVLSQSIPKSRVQSDSAISPQAQRWITCGRRVLLQEEAVRTLVTPFHAAGK